MEVKIDTKEKFTVVTPIINTMTANIAEELAETCLSHLLKSVRNLVLNMESVSFVEDGAADILSKIQQEFYEKNASFVICSLQPTVEASLEKSALLEILNVTPTQSEAWDIVQMEEIERELLDGDDMRFETNN